jgi:hypothetical protein
LGNGKRGRRNIVLTPKQFAPFLARDRGCLHCGDVETAVPNHRVNRGMGGSKKRDVPSNIVVLCSIFNGLIESDVKAARKAHTYGWKLASWEDPIVVPVYDAVWGKWWLLDDGFGRVQVCDGDRPF